MVHYTTHTYNAMAALSWKKSTIRKLDTVPCREMRTLAAKLYLERCYRDHRSLLVRYFIQQHMASPSSISEMSNIQLRQLVNANKIDEKLLDAEMHFRLAKQDYEQCIRFIRKHKRKLYVPTYAKQ